MGHPHLKVFALKRSVNDLKATPSNPCHYRNAGALCDLHRGREIATCRRIAAMKTITPLLSSDFLENAAAVSGGGGGAT